MTFKQAFDALIAELKTKYGWTTGIGEWPGTNYKVNYAESANGETRLWFKEMSMLYTKSYRAAPPQSRHTFGNAKRCMPSTFDVRSSIREQGVEKTVKSILSWIGSPADPQAQQHHVAQASLTVELDDEDDASVCPSCEGPLIPMGQLGRRIHYRCRNCGAETSNEV